MVGGGDGGDCSEKHLHFTSVILAQDDLISLTNQEDNQSEEKGDDSAILMKFIERIPSSTDEYSSKS